MLTTRAKENLSVHPAEYPPPPMMALAANIIGKCQFAGFLFLFLFDQVLPAGMRENKGMSFFGIWMGGATVSSALTKTDAFEIYMGKRLVWSSLTMGRKPDYNDLVQNFKKAGVELEH